MNFLAVILINTAMSGLWDLSKYNGFTLGIDVLDGKHIAILRISTEKGKVHIPMKGTITNKGKKYKISFTSDFYRQDDNCLEKIEIKANGVLGGDLFSDTFDSIGAILFFKDCDGKEILELSKIMGKWRRKNIGDVR